MFVRKLHFVSPTLGSKLEICPLRQRDFNSPKLFTAALEGVFRVLVWKGAGFNINGEYISHLRFANDVVVMADTMENVSTMPNELNGTSEQVGNKINMEKTMIIPNASVVPIAMMVEDSTLEVVEVCIYLSQVIQLGKSNFEK